LINKNTLIKKLENKKLTPRAEINLIIVKKLREAILISPVVILGIKNKLLLKNKVELSSET